MGWAGCEALAALLGLWGLLVVSLLLLTWSGHPPLLVAAASTSGLLWPDRWVTGEGRPGGFLTGVVTGGDVGTADPSDGLLGASASSPAETALMAAGSAFW